MVRQVALRQPRLQIWWQQQRLVRGVAGETSSTSRPSVKIRSAAIVAFSTAQTPSMDTPLTISGRTFRSRLIVGTGKYPTPEVMVAAHDASGAEMVTVAVRRVQLPGRPTGRDAAGDHRAHRHRPLHAAAQHRRLLHGGRRDPDGAARPRGGTLGVGEAGGDRRRADALPRQRGAGGSNHGPGEGRFHRPPLHERRSGDVPQAGGCGCRRRDAARRADRFRSRDSEPEQHPHYPGVRVGPGDRRRGRRHRIGRHTRHGAGRSTAC